MYGLPYDLNNTTSNAGLFFQMSLIMSAFSCEKWLNQKARAMPCHAWADMQKVTDAVDGVHVKKLDWGKF